VPLWESLQARAPSEVWRCELLEKTVLDWWKAVFKYASGLKGSFVYYTDADTVTQLRSLHPEASHGKAGVLPARSLLILHSDFVFLADAARDSSSDHKPVPMWWTFSPAIIRSWIEELRIKSITEWPQQKSDSAPHVLACFALLVKEIEKTCSEIHFLNSQLTELEDKVLHIQKMENIGLLARNVGHDLNNLLSPILGYAQFLKTDLPAESPLRRYADLIEKAATASDNLLQDLLRYAPTDKIQFVDIDLRVLVEEAVSSLARTMASKKIRVETKLPSERCRTEAIPDKILEAIVLTLLNAQAATPPGGAIHITLEQVNITDEFRASHRKASKPAYYRIRVQDHGGGMTPEVLARVYEPFFSTHPPGPGVGLGIPITEGILRYHHGFTEIESSPGKGTHFDLYLPVAPKSGPTRLTPVRKANPTELIHPGQSMRVLLIEDEPMAQDVISALLQQRNCIVTAADSGEAALEILRRRRDGFDLIMLDIVMPGMGGYETFLQIQQLEIDTPVVLSTGFAKDWHVTEILRMGAIGILRKPYSIAELANILELVRPSGIRRP
jgi:signal transduction histidine kinase/CheY-like chemotaxis protein